LWPINFSIHRLKCSGKNVCRRICKVPYTVTLPLDFVRTNNDMSIEGYADCKFKLAASCFQSFGFMMHLMWMLLKRFTHSESNLVSSPTYSGIMSKPCQDYVWIGFHSLWSSFYWLPWGLGFHFVVLRVDHLQVDCFLSRCVTCLMF
jgi:hypothetical protein